MSDRVSASARQAVCVSRRKDDLWKPLPRGVGDIAFVSVLAVLVALSTSCTPTVQVDAPKEPITINLNIKLDADVKLQIEEKAKEDVESKPIF